jgi:hypothetical protein
MYETQRNLFETEFRLVSKNDWLYKKFCFKFNVKRRSIPTRVLWNSVSVFSICSYLKNSCTTGFMVVTITHVGFRQSQLIT